MIVYLKVFKKENSGTDAFIGPAGLIRILWDLLLTWLRNL